MTYIMDAHVHEDSPVERVEHDLDYFQVRTLALAEILKEKGILTEIETLEKENKNHPEYNIHVIIPRRPLLKNSSEEH